MFFGDIKETVYKKPITLWNFGQEGPNYNKCCVAFECLDESSPAVNAQSHQGCFFVAVVWQSDSDYFLSLIQWQYVSQMKRLDLATTELLLIWY